MDKKITLIRSHISLPSKWIIKNQSQYETAQYLMEQERLGFNPTYFITFHYFHPDEVKKKMMNIKDGKPNFSTQLWKENPKDKFNRKRRID